MMVGFGSLTIFAALTLVLIPTLSETLEERFPRLIAEAESAPLLQGDPA